MAVVRNHAHEYVKSSEKSNGKATFFMFFNPEFPKRIYLTVGHFYPLESFEISVPRSVLWEMLVCCRAFFSSVTCGKTLL